jgi:cytochrome c-type biogenesis protein CcmH/NrfG
VSTVLIVIVAVMAVIAIGLLALVVFQHIRTKQITETQVHAKRDDASHHPEWAQKARAEANLAEEQEESTG